MDLFQIVYSWNLNLERNKRVTMIDQRAYTFIANIIPGHEAELRSKLATIDLQLLQLVLDASQGAILPFENLTTIHYSRFIVLDAVPVTEGGPYAAKLVFSTNYDGDESSHLSQLATLAKVPLESLFSHCESFTAKTSGDLQLYLKSQSVKASAFYVGTRERTRDQIREEATLRRLVETFIDGKQRADPEWARKDLRAARSAIIEHARQNGVLNSQLSPPINRHWILFLVGAVLLVPILVLVPLILVAALVLRYKEIKDPIFQQDGKTFELTPEAKNRIASAAKHENFSLQNQLTHLVPIKPGLFRLVLLKIVFWAINFLARNFFYEGQLGRIPSIHFARWVIIDQGRRLLFMSNFDGSWQNYLGDFVDKAAIGLTAVWSNTKLFPRTFFLLFKGAEDEERFKTWARVHQVDTQVWYSALPGLSVENINHNTNLRRLLFESSDMPDREWLQQW